MRARLFMPVGAKQEVGEAHPRHRMVGVMEDRFRIDPAGSIDGAHGGEMRSKFVERAEIGWCPLQNVNERQLRLVPTVERTEQRGAFDFGRDGRLRARRVSDYFIKRAQPRFLGEPWRPMA
jgi:hypothetical protein